jgi:hypothetical protein
LGKVAPVGEVTGTMPAAVEDVVVVVVLSVVLEPLEPRRLVPLPETFGVDGVPFLLDAGLSKGVVLLVPLG